MYSIPCSSAMPSPLTTSHCQTFPCMDTHKSDLMIFLAPNGISLWNNVALNCHTISITVYFFSKVETFVV